MPDSVLLEHLDEYVVKETMRRLRNGMVRLKKRCIDLEPEIEVDFQARVIVPGGLNAVTRTTSTTGKTVTEQPEQVTLEESTSQQTEEGRQTETPDLKDTTEQTSTETPDLKDTTEQTSTETPDLTDENSQNLGRVNTVEIEYEE